MTITLHCLDCGFRISLTLPGREPPWRSPHRFRAASAAAGAGPPGERDP